MNKNLRTLAAKISQKMREKGVIRALTHGLTTRTVEPRRRLLYACALAYRRIFLRNVIFIGITGSNGKTTAKDLTTAAISTKFKAKTNIGTLNRPHQLVPLIFRVRPWERWCVVEMAAAQHDQYLARSLRLVAPRIGIVTIVGTDHLSTFGSIEEIAKEKSKLVRALPRDGTAILNADDPRVAAMASLHAGRIITYGTGPEAMIRGADARCEWPERLSLKVTHEGQTKLVQTQLCGTHLVPSVLAALAAAVALGVPLDDAIAGVGTVPPFNRRMCPVDHPDGITFIRDEVKASPTTIYPALEFMRQAKAVQKVVVMGTISDYHGSSRTQYNKVARATLDVADHVVFVGPSASQTRGASDHERSHALRICITLDAARDYLSGILLPGALVLLKGSTVDNMREIMSLRLRPPEPGQTLPEQSSMAAEPAAGSAPTSLPEATATPIKVVLGLGNPHEKHHDSPHNVGHRILDTVADKLGAHWEDTDRAAIARTRYEEREILLIKPKSFMNKSGPAVAALAQDLGFTPAELLVVHDDMDMELGKIRAKMRGMDAGHRGLRSMFEALGTNEIRRVKLGIAPPPGEARSVDRLINPFSEVELETVRQSYPTAADRVLDTIRKSVFEAKARHAKPAGRKPPRKKGSRNQRSAGAQPASMQQADTQPADGHGEKPHGSSSAAA